MKLKFLIFLFGFVLFQNGVASNSQDDYDDSDMFMEPLDDHLPASSNVESQISPHQIQIESKTPNSEQKEAIQSTLGPLVSVLKPQVIIDSKLEEDFKQSTESTVSNNDEQLSEEKKESKASQTDAILSEEVKSNQEASEDTQNDEAQPIISILRPQEPLTASTGAVDLQGRDTRSWYPSFGNWEQPPLGHSRPFLNNQPEGAYSQRADPPYQQEIAFAPQKFLELRGYKDQFRGGSAIQKQVQSDANVDILGDGNFGVIQGGTFYPEKDSYDAESSDHFDDFSYFGPNNGHGRPSYYGGYGKKPNPKPYTHKQFENFRDFAEINAGVTPERQYSHYVVVYSNKNGTDVIQNAENISETQAKLIPKNIIEQLKMIDLETNKKDLDNEEIPEKKLSKSKRKLAMVMPEKKHKAKLLKKEKDMQSEPLLALS